MIGFRITTPKSRQSDKSFEQTVAEQLKLEAREGERLFSASHSAWEEDVKWTRNSGIGRGVVPVPPNVAKGLFSEVYTRNYKYNLVNYDAQPKFRTPTTKKVFKFEDGRYNAASAPGRITSRKASRQGDTIYTPYVNHPGHFGRRFDLTVAKIMDKGFVRNMQQAVGRWSARQWR